LGAGVRSGRGAPPSASQPPPGRPLGTGDSDSDPTEPERPAGRVASGGRRLRRAPPCRPRSGRALVVTTSASPAGPISAAGRSTPSRQAGQHRGLAAAVPAARCGSAYRAVEAAFVWSSPWGRLGAGKLGSGVIIDSQGDILTALHVVQGASSIRSVSPTGRPPPRPSPRRTPHDIAVLTPSKLPSVVQPAALVTRPDRATRCSWWATRSISWRRCRPGWSRGEPDIYAGRRAVAVRDIQLTRP